MDRLHRIRRRRSARDAGRARSARRPLRGCGEGLKTATSSDSDQGARRSTPPPASRSSARAAVSRASPRASSKRASHRLVHLVARAAADRVVRVVREQRAPGEAQRGPLVGRAEPRRERRAAARRSRAARVSQARFASLIQLRVDHTPGSRCASARAHELAAKRGRAPGDASTAPTKSSSSARSTAKPVAGARGLGDRRRLRLGQRVVDAVHQQDRAAPRARGQLLRRARRRGPRTSPTSARGSVAAAK